jgi:hypothetical protein
MKSNCPGIPPQSCMERCGRAYCTRWRPLQFVQGPAPEGIPIKDVIGLSRTPEEEIAYRAARFGPISRSEASQYSRVDALSTHYEQAAPMYAYTIGGPVSYVSVQEFRKLFQRLP